MLAESNQNRPLPRHLWLNRLTYRSWHRGCKETDLLFGRFADEVLRWLSDAELEQYEALLEEEDSDIWKWYVGQLPLPDFLDNGVWVQFKAVNERAVSK